MILLKQKEQYNEVRRFKKWVAVLKIKAGKNEVKDLPNANLQSIFLESKKMEIFNITTK